LKEKKNKNLPQQLLGKNHHKRASALEHKKGVREKK
jgi:hypothetical protein